MKMKFVVELNVGFGYDRVSSWDTLDWAWDAVQSCRAEGDRYRILLNGTVIAEDGDDFATAVENALDEEDGELYVDSVFPVKSGTEIIETRESMKEELEQASRNEFDDFKEVGLGTYSYFIVVEGEAKGFYLMEDLLADIADRYNLHFDETKEVL